MEVIIQTRNYKMVFKFYFCTSLSQEGGILLLMCQWCLVCGDWRPGVPPSTTTTTTTTTTSQSPVCGTREEGEQPVRWSEVSQSCEMWGTQEPRRCGQTSGVGWLRSVCVRGCWVLPGYWATQSSEASQQQEIKGENWDWVREEVESGDRRWRYSNDLIGAGSVQLSMGYLREPINRLHRPGWRHSDQNPEYHVRPHHVIILSVGQDPQYLYSSLKSASTRQICFLAGATHQ